MLSDLKLFNRIRTVFPVLSQKSASKVNNKYSHVNKNFINIKHNKVCLFKDSVSYLSMDFLCVCGKKKN